MATPTDEEKGPGLPPAADDAGARPEEPTTPSASDDDEDDERPDPVRLFFLSAVLVVLVCYGVWAYYHPPPHPYYTNIPGLDLSHLTPEQRDFVLRDANAMMCDCGDEDCHFTVAECRQPDKARCDVSLRLAGEIVKRDTGTKPIFTVKIESNMVPPGNKPGVKRPAPKASSAASGVPHR